LESEKPLKKAEKGVILARFCPVFARQTYFLIVSNGRFVGQVGFRRLICRAFFPLTSFPFV